MEAHVQSHIFEKKNKMLVTGPSTKVMTSPAYGFPRLGELILRRHQLPRVRWDPQLETVPLADDDDDDDDDFAKAKQKNVQY